MSFTSWLRSFRSVLASRRLDRNQRQRPLRAATHRPRLELLEDRCLLSFSPAVSYPVGTSPNAVLTADFNGDTRLDLAVVNYSSSDVSVLLGNGDGTFQPALTSATGAGPLSVAVGDFNADGKLDLGVTSNVYVPGIDGTPGYWVGDPYYGGVYYPGDPGTPGFYEGRVNVLLGNGNGTFQPPTSLGVAGNPQSVAVGDFNADGKMDLGVTSSVYHPGTPGTPAHTVHHYGYFQYDYTYPPGSGGVGPGYYPAYDTYYPAIPGTPTYYENLANVLLGNGDGSFALRSQQSLGGGDQLSASVAVGDFNGDGKLDLVATANVHYPGFYVEPPSGYGGGYGYDGYGGYGGYDGYWNPGHYEGRASVLLGNGDGTLRAATGISIGSSLTSVAVGDFNGDGNLDLVTANGSGNDVSVLLGDGLGALGAPQSFGTGSYPVSVVLGDFNHDNILDIATANNNSSDVSVLRGLGDGTFTSPVNFATGLWPSALAAGDFNGDGWLDAATANSGDGTVSVLLNTASWPSFVGSAFPSPTTAGEAHTITVTARDMDGNVLTGYTGTVHFTSSDPQADLPDDYTFTAGDHGTADFTVSLKTAGTQSLTVMDTVTPDFTATQGGIVVNPAAASRLDVFGFPSPQLAGTTSYVGVYAFDAYGNRATGYRGTVHITSSDPAATLSPEDYTFGEADSGLTFLSATFVTPGIQSLTVTDVATPGLTGTQAGIEVTTVSTFLVEGFRSPRPVGSADLFSVTVTDAYGITATNYTGTVHFTSTDPLATLPPDYTFTPADAGVHTFSATFWTAGTQSLTATATDTAGVTGTQGNIQVTAASTFLVYGFPSPVVGGAAGSITVFARDVYGQHVPGYRGTVHLTSTDGQATLPGDYTFTAADGGAHTFTVTLRTGGTQSITVTDTATPGINGTQGDITVRVPPTASINDVTVTEGNTGTVNATFTVSLSFASDQAITVHYETADGSATAGSDYAAASGDVTFAAGETSKNITIAVFGDRLPEPTENFVVNLSAPTNATIADGQGVGTIMDDEPRISIGDVSKKEGKKGQKTLFTFTVTLSAAYDEAVTMSFATANGTATTSDSDYLAKTGTLTFAPGETTKTITIEVKGDSKTEANETFYLDLYDLSSNALFTKNRGIATILNDD